MELEFEFLKVGYCKHLECMAVRGGRFGTIEFPSLVGLIRHPQRGVMLFDTGYTEHFFSETQSFPESLYRKSLPVSLPEEQKLDVQLHARSINIEDVCDVIVSHYHGDHISGLKYFNKARFWASESDSKKIARNSTGFINRAQNTLHGHLPQLLPNDYWQRVNFVEYSKRIELPTWLQPLDIGFDIFEDGSAICVPLPGHSKGQLGLLLPAVWGEGAIFLVADACWSLPACKAGKLPSRLLSFLPEDNRNYQKTFNDLSTIANREPSIKILPSHCNDTWNEFVSERK